MRRDFTINGLFYDPQKDEVIDHVDGEADLKAGILRTIGDPLERFGEDKLRMLRAVRFATTLGFEIDHATGKAIIEHADDISVVSGERIGAEMRRVLASTSAATGLRHLNACGLERVVLPEIEQVDLSRFEALTQHLTGSSFPTTMAALVGVLEHPLESLRAIASRWRLSNQEVRMVKAAQTHWPTIANSHALPWSMVQPVLMDRDAALIVQLAAAMVRVDGADDRGVTLANEALLWDAEKLDPPPLLTGDDLHEMGIPAGPQFKTILQSIRDAQLDGKIRTREQAIEMTH
jgi:tRNA nucleotidyltransferase (CCA-adding enzyme)